MEFLCIGFCFWVALINWQNIAEVRAINGIILERGKSKCIDYCPSESPRREDPCSLAVCTGQSFKTKNRSDCWLRANHDSCACGFEIILISHSHGWHWWQAKCQIEHHRCPKVTIQPKKLIRSPGNASFSSCPESAIDVLDQGGADLLSLSSFDPESAVICRQLESSPKSDVYWQKLTKIAYIEELPSIGSLPVQIELWIRRTSIDWTFASANRTVNLFTIYLRASVRVCWICSRTKTWPIVAIDMRTEVC